MAEDKLITRLVMIAGLWFGILIASVVGAIAFLVWRYLDVSK